MVIREVRNEVKKQGKTRSKIQTIGTNFEKTLKMYEKILQEVKGDTKKTRNEIEKIKNKN